MPTYDYHCRHCDHTFEHFQSITDKPLRTCPSCSKHTLRRLIGAGSALLFKGKGFYQTDYRSENYKKSEKAEKQATQPKKKSDKSTESAKSTGDSTEKSTSKKQIKTPPDSPKAQTP